ncbi:hypothetical protein CUR178_00146 [Leishmania enriettii]|uniref:Chorein N-terminal domain-containing protein n=1 Tax=Leishmania enriettii TaxID=5663 RepID=A0A836KH65_LEIEN|nr:hypothetical protein CUR178_00146 [Leishmania enriettii]
MLENHVAELLATYLSRFIENVNADQLQVSLWSGNVVLNNVRLRSDVLDSIAALLYGEHSSGEANDARGSSSAAVNTSSASSNSREGDSSNYTFSMRMLLAPFTVVKGVIRQLAITVPWASLESEPVRVQVVGVELVLGPLRARPFNSKEEQEREQAIKQQQLERYEKERRRLSQQATEKTPRQASSSMTASTEARHMGGETKSVSAGTSVALGTSWFSWLLDFDRMSQITLRNVSLTLQDISVRYELDYEGLHPSCASALCVFVKQVQVTTTDEQFQDVFNKDLLAPLCKRFVLSEVVVSTHAVCKSLHGALSGARDEKDVPMPIAGGGPAAHATAYDLYASRWAHSAALVRVEALQVEAKVTQPGCASKNGIVEETPILSASSTELTVATVERIEVGWCFGVVQVLESMWRSYYQSLPCARYRKRLHLLRLTGRDGARNALVGGASKPGCASLSEEVVSASRSLARQRWSFALRCVLDDVRQHRKTFGLHGQRRCEVVQAMVQFGHLRRIYVEYWRRTQGVIWAPPLTAVEAKKLQSMERQLSLWQVVFLRCLANAQLLVEQDGYARQQAFIEEARRRTKRGMPGSSGVAVGGGATSLLWGWLLGRFAEAKNDTASRSSTPSASITSRGGAGATSVSVHGIPSLCDLVALEWSFGCRYTSSHSLPLVQPSAARNQLSKLTENKLHLTLRVRFAELVVCVDPTYWPLTHGSTVPNPPSATPLRHVKQRLAIRTRAVELFYTTIPDDRPDKASLSFFIGSAAIAFEGVLRSVLLQSKEPFREDYVVVKRNARGTHIGVWVAPQLVICQPMHEWAWWYAEMSAFVGWLRMVYRVHDVSGSAEASPCAISAFAESSPLDVHKAASASGRTTASCSGRSTPRCQPSQAATEATAPLIVNVTIQSLDVCVPLFARDIESSDLEIFSHQPSAFSSAALAGSLPDTLAPESYTGCGKWHWRLFSEIAWGEGGGTEGSPESETNLRICKGAPFAPPLREAGDFQSVSVQSDIDECNCADSLDSSHGGSLSIFASATPARYFLNNESCLVLSVSTTRLWTVAPAMKRYNGPENEYYICVGDHSKAVRLFCQNSYDANALITERQLELLSFVAGEVLLNPKELTVLFNKGINAVADPAAFALVNDALLKPTVFADADVNGRVVRAVIAELQQAACRLPNTREPAVPWLFRSSTCVELRSESGSAPELREVPPHCARHIMSTLTATFSITPSRTTTVTGATPSTKLATGVFGGRVLTVGMGVARLLIRSEENVDLAELVLVAPEHLPSATAPYREALAALGAEEPRAMELMCDLVSSQSDAVGWRSCDELPLNPPTSMACPGFLLSIPDITMTTAAGRKLLNIENLTVVRSRSTSRRSETALTVQTVSAFCDLVLVQVLEVLAGTVLSVRPLTPPPQAAAYVPMGASRSEAVDSEMQRRVFAGDSISLRVQTTRLQIPLSLDDVVDAPYVEVTVYVEDVLCTLGPFTDDSGRDGQRVHLQLTVSEAMQLADYVGGDPEVRNLISAHSRKNSCIDDSTAHPLQCVVDVTLPGACTEATETSASTSTATPPSTTIRVRTVGGALHVYFPFLYFYAAAVETDERIVRLGELVRSPLLRRGYTHAPSVAESTRGAWVAGNAPPSSEAAPLLLLVEATISDLKAMLATDAAVPIDVSKPDTLSVVHMERILCGLRRTLSDSPCASAVSGTRTHAFVDATGVQLLDWLAETRDVSLPNVKLRAEMGAFLVPNKDLTGYAYQSGSPNDWTLLVEVHPTAAPSSHRAASLHNAASSSASHSSDVTIHLSVQQCLSLFRFFLSNFFQLPTPSSRRRPISGGGHRRHALGAESTIAVQTEVDTALLSSQYNASALASKPATVPSAVTLLLTVPSISVVLDADDCIMSEKRARRATMPRSGEEGVIKSSTPAARPSPPPLPPSVRHTSYEVSLRRGAQLYSTVGGRRFTSPMTSCQLSGVELLAREEVQESSAGHAGTAVMVTTHLLLTVDAVSLALVEQRAGLASDTVDDYASDEAAVVKISAQVRHAHLHVPHIQWWLRLYSILAGGYSSDVGGDGCATCTQGPYASVGNAASFRDVVQSGNEWASGQGSSTSGGHLLTSRGGYVDEEKVTWLRRQGHLAWPQRDSRRFHGTVDMLHTKAFLFAVGSTSQNQQPLCQLTVSEAKITASPMSALHEGGREHIEDTESVCYEFLLEVPHCPELLLLRVSEETDGAARLETQRLPKSCYASVLRWRPAQVPYKASTGPDLKSSNWRQATASAGELASPPPPLPSAHSNVAFLSLRFRCSSDTGSSEERLCGRCYYVTGLTLHRTTALHVRLQHVLLEIPAAPLFSLAREVLRQAAEMQSVEEMAPLSRTWLRDDRDTESVSLTYMGIEVDLTDAEVRLDAGPAPRGDLTARRDAGSDSVSCCVAVDSARLTTNVQLHNVLASTREAAVLIGDELSGEWRVQICHMIPQLIVQGVVVSTISVTQARWPLPDMRIKASLPLTRRVLCVRAQRATGAEDGVEHSCSSHDTALRTRLRSTANVFLVEPTAPATFGELHYHVLASLHVDAGPVSDDTGGGTPGPKAPVQVCVPAILALASAAARLVALWQGPQRTCDRSAEAGAGSRATGCNAGWWPHSAQRRLGLLTWYEFVLCFSGRRVDVALDTPVAMAGDKTASAVKADSVVCVSVDGAVTVQVERVVTEEAGEEASVSGVVRNDAAEEEGEWGSSADGENVAVVATHTLFRLRSGPLYVYDGVGSLVLQVSEAAQSTVVDALITDYIPAEARLLIRVGRVVVHASCVTAVFMVRLWRAYGAWRQRWENITTFMSRFVSCLQQGKSIGVPAMPGENSRQSGRLQNIIAEVSDTEVLLAPAARLCARLAHMTLSPANVEGGISTAAALRLRCEEACLYSMMPQSDAACEMEPAMLARTLSPVLVVASGQQQAPFLQYCTPLLSIFNGDGHSWAMCTLRASNVVRGMLTAVAVGVDIDPPEESANARLAKAPVPSWVMWISRAEVDVHRAELLCFAPRSKRICSPAPVVRLVARQAVLRHGYSAGQVDSSDGGTAAGARLKASAVISATYRSGASTDAQAHPLLDDVTTTFVLSSSSQSTSGQVEVAVSASAAARENAVSFHVPTGDALESTVAALWLLARAQVPRRYAPARAGKRGLASGAQVIRGAWTLWHVRADVPSVLFRFLVAETASPFLVPTLTTLCSIRMDDIHAEMRTRYGGEEGGGRPPFLAVWVSSLVGETVLKDAADTMGESAMEVPWKFFVLRPVVEASSDRPPCEASATAGNTSTGGGGGRSTAGFSVVQRSLPRSTGGEARDRGAPHIAADDATALVIRLQTLHAHPSMALLKLLMERVLRPCLTGKSAANANARSTHVLEGLEDTVLRVDSVTAVLPKAGPVSRHAGQVRVIEVVADWTLYDDLRLGGEGGFQLYFRGTGGRSVITVRGGGGAGDGTDGREDQGSAATIFLSLPVGANGEVCPAIRVDPDLTARFENVRVVVGEESLSARQDAFMLEEFVELGERSLCLLPPTLMSANASPVRDAAEAPTEGVEASATDDIGDAVTNTAVRLKRIASSWAVSVMSIDVAVGFDVSLTAGARRLAATGGVTARYHFEEKRNSVRSWCSEHEGECSIVLHTCVSESGPLTVTPVAATAQLSSAAGENRLVVVLNGGSAGWRLPLGHARVLIELTRLAQRSLCQAPLPSPAKRSWHPRATGSTWTREAARRPIPLDVRADVPSWILTLTNDTGSALAVLVVEHVRLQCSTDVDFADAALAGEASVSLRDCVEFDEYDGHRDTTALNATKGPRAAPSTTAKAGRVLLSAQPHISLSFTRFCTGSHSLSVSVHLDDVVATLPMVTALRLLQSTAEEVNAGKCIFWNDCGVEMEVTEPVPHDTASRSSLSRWRMAAAPGRLVRTNIPVSSPVLMLTPVEASVSGISPSAARKDVRGNSGVAFCLQALGSGSVCRVSLPGYDSALCALDLVVRKSVREGVEVVHLTTSVVLTNMFYASPPEDPGAAPLAASIVAVTADCARLVVPPRSARYMPLPLLRESLAVELGDCAYAPVAKMLTWAMMADAMTAVADQAAGCGGGGSGGSQEGGAAAGLMLYGNLHARGKGSPQNGNDHSSELRAPALCGRVRALDAYTLTFPMLLCPAVATLQRPLRGARTGDSNSRAALAAASVAQSQASVSHIDNVSGTGRVVQLTWRRGCSRQSTPLFSGRLVPSEYTVAVEPVWTLWNWTGCRLRLRLRTSRDGVIDPPLKPPYSASSPLSPLSTRSGSGSDVVAAAEVENGGCFQWTPATLAVLQGTVFAFFQLMAPALPTDSTALPSSPSRTQWWSAAAPLSLQEPPPPYVRLQQSNGATRGALRVEQHGPSSVVLRCAALLRSGLTRPVYLRDADEPQPLLGTGAHGCVIPHQQVPLFYSEYVTALAPNADRVGFKVRDRPIATTGASSAAVQESDAYYLTSPVVSKLLSAGGQTDCTCFYTVSTVPDAKVERTADVPAGKNEKDSGEEHIPAQALSFLCAPEPPTVVQLCSLCRIRNTDLHRTLLVRPYYASAESNMEAALTAPRMITLVAPGEERGVIEFSPHAKEPEVQFCYTASGSESLAHMWSPPVRLLTLATLTQPLVLKHTCVPRHVQRVETNAPAEERLFTMTPARRRAGESVASTMDHFRCLTVQSSMTSVFLRVSVGLQAEPPVKIVNRLKTTLQFAQCARATESDLAARPRGYVVAAESMSYMCWEVPVLESPGLRLTLYSNVRKGFSVSHDVDLLRCAASPSSGARVGITDAYVYVSLDHRIQQYTVTVVPSRQLECRMLFQPRRLTQLEVYVHSCTVYVAAITVPTTGPFARKSLIALGARGRMRLHRGVRSEGASRDTVPLHATDEDVLTFLKGQELDVVLVRLLGFYGSAMVTERHLVGNASLALLEVVDCTTVEEAYPVLLRVGPRAGALSATAFEGTAAGERAAKAEREGGSCRIVAESSGGTAALVPAASVPQFKDPSWLSVEVQLTRPEETAAADRVMILPMPHLRVTVPLIVVRADDDFLFTLRTTAERLREEWAAAAPAVIGDYAAEQRGSLGASCSAIVGDTAMHSPRCVYNIFLYVLRISPIVAEVTYTRRGHRHYRPFEGLARIPENLIPSVEGLSVSFREVKIQNVELRSSNSLFEIARSLLWPLYRTQLLLQSYKVVGSLDVLGNPRALLGSWSRGVWHLFTNSTGQGRWAGTREFLRTTASSTLHSVGAVTRSIGNLVGTSPPAVAPRVSYGSSSSVSRVAALSTPPRLGVLGELLHEVGGGISDAVTKPIRGAREGGVSGFLVGVAAGMVGLAGRPVFGFFRGVSATSEFYARLVGGLGELTELEARRLGLERNYRVMLSSATEVPASLETDGVEGEVSSSAAEMLVHGLPRAPRRRLVYLLTHAMYDQVCMDVPRWRRGEEANVRLAVDRVGIYNTALHTPYASLCAFFSPSEFRAALPCALTALLANKLIALLTHSTTRGACRGALHADERGGTARAQSDTGEDEATWMQQTHEYARASNIKASLGVRTLQKHVTEQAFVRVCSLAEMEAIVTAQEVQQKYSVAVVRAISAAGEHLLAP